MVPIGEKILKLIQDMNFDAHPLIFHIFSNGGAFLYQHINLAVVKHKSRLQVRGVIFDSAPGERRMLGLYRAITAIYGRGKPCNCLTALVITITLSIMWFVEVGGVKSDKKRQSAYYLSIILGINFCL